MKTLVILLAFLISSPLLMQAQDQVIDQDRDQTRLMMVDGELLQIKDRDQVRLQDKITLNDGTVLSPNGRYVTSAGKKLRLRDGECLDMNGVKYNNEYQYRSMVRQENKGMSQEQMTERNKNRTHFIAMDGHVYRVRNQEQQKVQHQMILNNGMKINPDGTYQMRDQRQLRLKDGECLNLDGQKFQNIMQQRKMVMHKNMNANKNLNKVKMQRKVQKSGKKTNSTNKRGNN